MTVPGARQGHDGSAEAVSASIKPMTNASGDDTRLRYQRSSQVARDMLKAEGESGRFEFKRNAAAVKPEVLVAAANWVALDTTRQKVIASSRG